MDSNAGVYALDIEPGLFPREDPAIVARGNVHFHVGSITALPTDWEHKFCLIHQRLLIAALRKEEWEKALAEMLRALVPGGWVQLEEIGTWKAGGETEGFTNLTDAMATAKELVFDCALIIPGILRRTGFVEVSVEKIIIPLGSQGGQLAVDARTNWMGAFRGLKTPILKAGGFGYVHSEEEYDAKLGAVEREWEAMPEAHIEYFVFTAKKPLL